MQFGNILEGIISLFIFTELLQQINKKDLIAIIKFIIKNKKLFKKD